MSLATEIAEWDQKKVDPILRTYRRYSDQAEFADQIIGMLGEPELEVGASWLLKRHCESGFRPSTGQVRRIHRDLKQLENWAALLHVLQCFEYWKVPQRQRKSTEAFLVQAQDHPKTLVRAWALNGWFHFAAAFPDARPEVRQRLETAAANSKGSIAARARQLLKQGWE